MFSLTMAVALQVSVLGATPDVHSYSDARELASQNGTPIVVLVGAKWCPACVSMKNGVIPQALREGVLDDVVFAQVDLDTERELAQKLIAGRKIPQLVMYTQAEGGWKSERVIGGQSVGSIRSFVEHGIKKHVSDRDAVADRSSVLPK